MACVAASPPLPSEEGFDFIGEADISHNDDAESQWSDARECRRDIVCSVCSHRLTESEIAYGHGTGALPGFGEVVDVVTCSTCFVEGGSFVREKVDAGTEKLFSPKRMEVERDREQLRAALAKSTAAEEEATARARVAEEEIERLRAENLRIKEKAAEHMPAERQGSWWALWRRSD